MNIKRFIVASLLLFIVFSLYDWLVHGVLLTAIYQETASLWRAHEDMLSYLPIMDILKAFIALWMTFIFTRFYPDGGVLNGLCLGIFFGVFSAIQAVSAYFFLPIPLMLGIYWFLAYLFKYVFGGLVIGWVYRSA